MIDNQNQSVYQTLQKAQGIFEKKCKDYGTAWRDMRIISIADQLFIKATRIGVICCGDQKVNGVGDDIGSELLGIINYSVIGIIQNRLDNPKPGDAKMSADDAINNYFDVVKIFNNYFKSQNPHYVEEIEKLNIKSISDGLLGKIQRLKNFHNQKNEAISVLNFGAFLEIILWSSIGHANHKAT